MDLSVPYTSGSSVPPQKVAAAIVAEFGFQFPIHRDPRFHSDSGRWHPGCSWSFSSLYIDPVLPLSAKISNGLYSLSVPYTSGSPVHAHPDPDAGPGPIQFIYIGSSVPPGPG